MTLEQLAILMNWVKAMIDEKMGDNAGRDTLHETMNRREYEKDLAAVFNLNYKDLP